MTLTAAQGADERDAFVFDGGEVRKIKAQMIRRDQRSRLLHVLSQNFTQSSMKKMSRRVVAHGGLANLSVDDGVDLVAHANRLLRHNLKCAHTLNRRISSRHLGDDIRSGDFIPRPDSAQERAEDLAQLREALARRRDR